MENLQLSPQIKQDLSIAKLNNTNLVNFRIKRGFNLNITQIQLASNSQ